MSETKNGVGEIFDQRMTAFEQDQARWRIMREFKALWEKYVYVHGSRPDHPILPEQLRRLKEMVISHPYCLDLMEWTRPDTDNLRLSWTTQLILLIHLNVEHQIFVVPQFSSLSVSFLL